MTLKGGGWGEGGGGGGATEPGEMETAVTLTTRQPIGIQESQHSTFRLARINLVYL